MMMDLLDQLLAHFNPKGLIDTLISMGVETTEYSLSFKVNKLKIFLKSILRIFFKKKFLGKNLTTVCRGLFLCKKFKFNQCK